MLQRGLIGLIMLLTILAGTPVLSQATQPTTVPAPPTQPGSEAITQDVLEALKKQVEGAKDLDDATRTRIQELLRQTGENINRATELMALSVDSQQKLATIDERLRARTEELEALRQDAKPQLTAITGLAELETDLTRLEGSLAELKNRSAEAEAEPKRRATRRKDARALMISAPQRLEEVNRLAAVPAPAGEPPLVTRARQIELGSRKQLIQLETPSLQAELTLYDAEDAVELPRMLRELLSLQIAQRTEEVRLRSEEVAAQRREEARQQAAKARKELLDSHPALLPYAERNQVITEKSREISTKNEAATKDLNEVRELLDSTRKRISQVKEKVRSVGLTGPIGLRLRQQRVQLPDVKKLRQRINDRMEIIETAQLDFFEYDDELADLASIDPLIESVVDKAGPELTEPQETQIREATRDILEHQREYLATLVNTYNSYTSTLGEIDDSERQLVKEIDNFDTYVNERVLWIRSHLPLTLSQIRNDRAALNWVVTTGNWRQVCQDLLQDLFDYPLLYGFFVIAWFTLFFSQRRMRNVLTHFGERAERRSFHQFGPTLKSLGLTILIAFPWFALPLFVGWRLLASTEDEFSHAFGRGLLDTTPLGLALQLLRQMCRQNGLIRSHLGWPAKTAISLRANLYRLMLPGLPLVLLTATMHTLQPETSSDAMERCLFIAAMLLLASVMARLLRPYGEAMRPVLAETQGGWLDRLRYVWYPTVVAGPLVIVGMTYAGYYYTALQLAWKFLWTAGLLVGLLLLNSLLVRWVIMSRRKASIDAARERLAASAAQTEAEASAPSLPVPTANVELDIHSVSEQSRRLLNLSIVVSALIGLWLLWVDVLPALNFLDRWPLWHTTASVTEQVERPDGTFEYRTIERPDVVTVIDVGFALLLALLILSASRNIPGLMEMGILRRLPLSDSARYAITTLTSYSLVLLGLIVSSRTIGLRWEQIQWLAAALTFGLGFGLQEVFANLVSGLIILFEQPVRVGDVVTIDGVSGVVNRIRIRATTITDWDRKEYIVPNKELITGRVLNWTLSDRVNRLVIHVGVAFGSDTDFVRRLIMQAAVDNENILREPPPVVTLDELGESSLNFTLRAYLPNLETRLETMHWLNSEIHRRLNSAGVEIPFPQRDLHIRTLPESFPGASSGMPASQ